MWLENSMISRY